MKNQPSSSYGNLQIQAAAWKDGLNNKAQSNQAVFLQHDMPVDVIHDWENL